MLAVCVQQATNIQAEHSKKPYDLCWEMVYSYISVIMSREEVGLSSPSFNLCLYCVLLYVSISFREKRQNLNYPYCSIY